MCHRRRGRAGRLRLPAANPRLRATTASPVGARRLARHARQSATSGHTQPVRASLRAALDRPGRNASGGWTGPRSFGSEHGQCQPSPARSPPFGIPLSGTPSNHSTSQRGGTFWIRARTLVSVPESQGEGAAGHEPWPALHGPATAPRTVTLRTPQRHGPCALPVRSGALAVRARSRMTGDHSPEHASPCAHAPHRGAAHPRPGARPRALDTCPGPEGTRSGDRALDPAAGTPRTRAARSTPLRTAAPGPDQTPPRTPPVSPLSPRQPPSHPSNRDQLPPDSPASTPVPAAHPPPAPLPDPQPPPHTTPKRGSPTSHPDQTPRPPGRLTCLTTPQPDKTP